MPQPSRSIESIPTLQVVEPQGFNAYSLHGGDDACTNGAEEFFSRMRRAEIGHHHHISGIYLDRYAKEAAFREDRRRQSNGEQFSRIVSLVASNGPSVDFCGYWQRSRQAN